MHDSVAGKKQSEQGDCISDASDYFRRRQVQHGRTGDSKYSHGPTIVMHGLRDLDCKPGGSDVGMEHGPYGFPNNPPLYGAPPPRRIDAAASRNGSAVKFQPDGCGENEAVDIEKRIRQASAAFWQEWDIWFVLLFLLLLFPLVILIVLLLFPTSLLETTQAERSHRGRGHHAMSLTCCMHIKTN